MEIRLFGGISTNGNLSIRHKKLCLISEISPESHADVPPLLSPTVSGVKLWTFMEQYLEFAGQVRLALEITSSVNC